MGNKGFQYKGVGREWGGEEILKRPKFFYVLKIIFICNVLFLIIYYIYIIIF